MTLLLDTKLDLDVTKPILAVLVAQDGTDYVVLKADPTTRRLEVELATGIAGVTIVDGGDVAQGAKADAPASASVDEDTTARTQIALLKGVKNLLIDVVGKQLADDHNVVVTTMPVVTSVGDTLSQTPTVTVGAYVANDAVGGLLTFANAARTSGAGGVIKDLIILDDAGQDAMLELWLFNATFTAMNDNAPWSPSEADLRKLVAIIRTVDGAWCAAGTPSAARVEVSQRYDLVGTGLFGQLVTRGTPTFAAADDVTVILGLLQD